MSQENAITRQEFETIIQNAKEEITLAFKADIKYLETQIFDLKRDSRRNGDLLRETLWHASGKLPQYKPTDGRSIGVIKEGMVQTAIERILGGEATSPRAIVNSVLDQYKDIPGAYNSFAAFMKQVERALKKTGHNLKDMS